MKVNRYLIRVERLRRGWSRSDLAKRIDRSVATVSRLEHGKFAPPRVLKEVADLLNIPMDKLITTDEEDARQ